MNRAGPTITIIGAGAVGTAWLDFFKDRGYPVTSVWKSETGYLADEDYHIHRELNRPLPESDEEIGDWVFITTPDDSIAPAAKLLAESNIHWTNRTVIHCSGSLSADVLKSLKERGARTISVHPIQTFQKGDGKEKLEGVTITLQGDEETVENLREVVLQLHSKPVLLSEQQKMAVHIAAVFASNYLVALLNTSEQILKESGVDAGIEIMVPLIRQTVENVLTKGTGTSLTGPISRGDENTVKNHLHYLSKDKAEARLYKALGQACLNIVQEKESLSEARIEHIRKALGGMP
ncbi:Rossmann-like and DUF2520 domain-containing protein [Rhodohalobacter halophilus]|uniref:Rossmann-like and DUF2520 domain-containing protein n=1 Tax=Rhodohalobacter halophilus TaxID=1812810 RepID=UPI00083F677D|nr:Rossmann-like and DUF2520 domain-containing protein [Rhodohalobacter halophilus]